MYDKVVELKDMIQGFDAHSPQVKFCNAFIQHFNNYQTVANMVVTGKLKLADNKTENAVGYAKEAVLDGVGFIVPTNVLGHLATDITHAAFQGYRTKGYKKLADTTLHSTHVEILSQTLAYALLVKYQETLCDTEDKASDLGKKTAQRLIDALKHKEEGKKPKIRIDAQNDTLLQRARKMLTRIVHYDYIKAHRATQSNQQAINLTDDDLQTLMAFSAATLLGLRLDCFVDLELLSQTQTLTKNILNFHEQRLTDLEQSQTTHVKGEFTLTYTHLCGVKFTFTAGMSNEEVHRGKEIVKELNQQPLNPDLIKYGLVKPLPPKEELAELLNPFKANMMVEGKLTFNIENYVWGAVTILPRLEMKTDAPTQTQGTPQVNP